MLLFFFRCGLFFLLTLKYNYLYPMNQLEPLVTNMHPMKNPVAGRWPVCFLAAIFLAVLNLHASSYSWSGNTSPNWANTNNWSPLNTVGPLPNDQLFFGFAGSSGTTLSNDFTAGTIFNGLSFQSSGSAFTFAGNAIGLNGGITNSGTSAQVISNNLTLKATESLNACPSYQIVRLI